MTVTGGNLSRVATDKLRRRISPFQPGILFHTLQCRLFKQRIQTLRPFLQ